jgi:hypothetical protein
MKEGGKLAGGNPARGRAENDFYATHPDSTKAILGKEELLGSILEPACGEGHISKEILKKYPNADLYSCDLVDRGYGFPKNVDFLRPEYLGEYHIVITNPPFNLFQEFVEKALKIATKKVIMFGKLQALEGIKRATFLQKTPLRTVYVFKKRQQPMRNGKSNDEITGKKMSSTMAFAWFVWEVGYTGKPQIEWI